MQLYLVKMLRMSDTMPALPHVPSWHAQRQSYLDCLVLKHTTLHCI